MLTLLTCRHCPEASETLRRHLNDTLATLRLSSFYTVVEATTMPPDDIRRAIPAPTVLWLGRDLFESPLRPTTPLSPT